MTALTSRRGRRRARWLLAVAVVAALGVSACSGIPTSSDPQTIQSVGVGAPSVPPVTPVKDGGPRVIVQGFLAANAADPSTNSVQAFLTPSARSTWSPDTPGTTVLTNERVSTYSENKVTVTGQVVGTISPAGVYAPNLGSLLPFSVSFTLTEVGGQYRIDQLKNGLIVTAEQFESNFRAVPIYFPDAAEQYLVADLRYTALNDVQQIAAWVLSQLVNQSGGSSDLPNNAVSTETIPAQAKKLTANIGSVTTVAVAGANQLSGALRNLLAAQVSWSLDYVLHGAPLTIMDGTKAVTVPEVHGTEFSSSDFADSLGPAAPAQQVYYLDRGGRVHDDSGATISGPFGNGSNPLQSVAPALLPGSKQLTIAGVPLLGSEQKLVLGPQAGPVHTVVPVAGLLSRPAWAPGQDEVWIGNGPQLIRVVTNGRTDKVGKVAVNPVTNGRIVAVRLSPDGERIAMVIANTTKSAQLYVGLVVRGNGAPQVAGLHPISPPGVVLTDVAWSDSLKLFAIGHTVASGDGGVYDVSVDGAHWTDLGTGSLPGEGPDSLTMTTQAPAWVSAGNYVWVQSSGTWVSPINVDSGQTPGQAPIYLS